jgi:hypothetical protein
VRILFLSVLTGVIACGPSNRGHDPGGPDAPNPGDSGTTDMSRVYAHSGTALYRVDTTNLGTVMVGPMTGLGTQSLTDLAIDKADHMVGITLDKLYSIDSQTGTVTLVKDLSQSARGFTSLSYVPTDLNDPGSADILVSANDQGDVFQIDPTTGNATKIGSYGTAGAGKVISSGDLVGVRGLGIYATVDVGTEPNDYLAKIDPVTWKATPIGVGTGFNHIFGLGYWAGRFYGFVDAGPGAGVVILIDPNTGVGTQIAAGSERWYGAGVTTDAPVIQ